MGYLLPSCSRMDVSLGWRSDFCLKWNLQYILITISICSSHLLSYIFPPCNQKIIEANCIHHDKYLCSKHFPRKLFPTLYSIRCTSLSQNQVLKLLKRSFTSFTIFFTAGSNFRRTTPTLHLFHLQLQQMSIKLIWTAEHF